MGRIPQIDSPKYRPFLTVGNTEPSGLAPSKNIHSRSLRRHGIRNDGGGLCLAAPHQQKGRDLLAEIEEKGGRV